MGLGVCVLTTPTLTRHAQRIPFVLPHIDQIIDSTARCELLCFLDAYSGYHQIKMALEDQGKTAFITPFGIFCYTYIAFGLKNAGATYQRTVQSCFKEQ